MNITDSVIGLMGGIFLFMAVFFTTITYDKQVHDTSGLNAPDTSFVMPDTLTINQEL